MLPAASKTDILNTILDGLHAKRAFEPMPGATHPAVAAFHQTPPPPGAGPLFRYAKPNDKGQLPTQHFHDWQKAFFSRALLLYMHSRSFAGWLHLHAAEQQDKPFSEFEWDVLKKHTQTVIDETAKTYGFDHRDSCERMAEPGCGEDKAGPFQWRNARALAEAQPALMMGTALFQAAQLTFLRDLMHVAATRDDFSMYELRVLGRAIQRLALNFETGRFHLITVWVAAAHVDRTHGNRDEPIKPADYACAWQKMMYGGGFVTEIADEGGTRRVECPYKEWAQQVARHDVCARNAAASPAHMLYCLGQTAATRQPDALTLVQEGLRFRSLYSMPQAPVPLRTQFDVMNKTLLMRAAAHRQHRMPA